MKLFLELSDAPVVRNQETRAPTQARVSFLLMVEFPVDTYSVRRATLNTPILGRTVEH